MRDVFTFKQKSPGTQNVSFFILSFSGHQILVPGGKDRTKGKGTAPSQSVLLKFPWKPHSVISATSSCRRDWETGVSAGHLTEGGGMWIE